VRRPSGPNPLRSEEWRSSNSSRTHENFAILYMFYFRFAGPRQLLLLAGKFDGILRFSLPMQRAGATRMQQPGAKKSAPPNTLQGQCGLYDFSLLFSSSGQ
jgi:hypothetical protein